MARAALRRTSEHGAHCGDAAAPCAGMVASLLIGTPEPRLTPEDGESRAKLGQGVRCRCGHPRGGRVARQRDVASLPPSGPGRAVPCWASFQSPGLSLRGEKKKHNSLLTRLCTNFHQTSPLLSRGRCSGAEEPPQTSVSWHRPPGTASGQPLAVWPRSPRAPQLWQGCASSISPAEFSQHRLGAAQRGAPGKAQLAAAPLGTAGYPPCAPRFCWQGLAAGSLTIQPSSPLTTPHASSSGSLP